MVGCEKRTNSIGWDGPVEADELQRDHEIRVGVKAAKAEKIVSIA